MKAVAVRRLSESNMDLTKSLHDHTKILVAACNGPAIGLAGAILGVRPPESLPSAQLSQDLNESQS